MANLLKGKLDSFCSPGSLFWLTNGSCIHHTGLGQYSSPGLTVCFEDTAILYTISLLFWVSAGLRLLWNGANSVAKPNSFLSAISVVKVVVISVPVITAVCDFIFTVYEGTHQHAANFQYLQPIAVLTTSILAAAVTVHERWLGIRSSALMFLLWLGLVIYGVLKMWTLVALTQEFDEVSDKFRFVTFCLQFTTYLIEFILALIPDSRPFTLQRKGERRQSPEEGATFLSKITWWWLNRLIWLGWRKGLVYSNLADLNEQDKSKTVVPSFMKYWDHELNRSRYHSRTHSTLKSQSLKTQGAAIDKANLCRQRKRGPSLLMAVAKTIWKPMAVSAVLKLAQDLLGFVSPQILRLLINFASNSEVPDWKGYLYAVLLFAVAFTQAMLLQQHFIRVYTAGMRVRTAVIAAVYNKALRLSSRARRERTIGEIVNLMSVDAERLKDVITYIHSIWSAPLQIVLAIVFLWFTMGPSIFVGVMVLLILIPLNTGLAAIQRRYQVQQLAKKDGRLKLISEVLNGIKVIKLYAWEIPFQKQISDIREAELRILRKSAIISIASTLTWYTAPFLVTLATIGTYVQVHRNDPNNRLTAERTFVALSLFNLLQFPLIMLPYIISKIIDANVSMKRVRSFLKSSELDPGNVQWCFEAATGDEDSVSIVNGTFTWDEIERPTLSSLHLHIKPGQLVAVVGQVGAGKSSLISSLLGDMQRLEGSITLRGSVAYVPQQAWILNTTLKDNILFGKPEDTTYYETILHSCALDPDLKVLPGGDMTEIGEKGINLSGGQKQRVSLARAVYQDSEVYLMDDPLSAVDAHVSTHIFEKVVGPEGLLKGKVRILVTHGLTHLPQCDMIVVMEGGRIVEQGSYSELIENRGFFADFLRTYTNVGSEDQTEHASDDADVETPEHFSKPDYKSKGPEDGCVDPVGEESVLIEEEKAQKGVVNFSVILSYCKACTYWMAGVVLLMNCILNGFAVASNFWLAKWSTAVERTSSNSTVDVGYYLSIFSVLGFGQVFSAIFAFLFLVLATIKGSRTIHSKMLTNILRSPMSFFDTTPLGRIMNRFSKDIYNIDEVIPISIDDFLASFFMVVSVILVVTISTPIFVVIILPLGVFYWFVQRFYIATARQLERLVSITRSPIYSHFQESIAGATSIRAYKEQQRFIQESARRVDDNNVAYYPRICANRWLAVRLEFIGNLVVFFAALFAAIQRNYSDQLNLHISAGIVGLSITYALQVTTSLNWMVRMASELEANIVAVERTKEYSELPTEAPASIDGSAPPPEWPRRGCIKFEHYSTRYREGLDLVLKDITIEIQAGLKIGIVGRTGAGKSSFTLALFRIIEAASGSIVIDDVDIASIGLKDLRSRITIIPQDPVIFAGTLRTNLDPFDLYTDDEIWCALGSAHLQTFVSTLDGGLNHVIAEGGENLSVGQRQLVCLARALLRKTKVLVLDEATAAVDLETDNLIQETIRSAFASCTILTIAHRINTIMDYDYVMVLQEGSIVEYDAPCILLEKKGQFYSMAKHARVV